VGKKSALTLVGLLAVALLTSGFKPFTQVRNVCPTCKSPPTFDTVVLLTGGKIRCDVIAQNTDHYVLQRFGELRMVKKSDVSSVEWKAKTPPTLTKGDQILLHSGSALHGAIVAEQKGRYFVIQVGTHKLTVWVGLIQAVYKNGAAYTYK